MNYCRKCGSVIEPEDKYCKSCGCATANNLLSAPENIADTEISLQTDIVPISDVVQEKTKHIKIIPIIISAAIISAVIALVFVFYKPILSQYYTYKADSSKNDTSKLLYASKSLALKSNKKSKDILKALLSAPASSSRLNVESIMRDFSSSLSKADYKDIFSAYTVSNFRNAIKNQDYNSAIYKLKDMKNMGINFKKENGYKNMMQFEINLLEQEEAEKGAVNSLSRGCNFYSDIDNDGFDEIFTVHDSSTKHNGETIFMYKYKDSYYQPASTYTFNEPYALTLKGAYNYCKDKKGIFIEYINPYKNADCISVLSAQGGTLTLKGTVSTNELDEIVDMKDVNKDGITEISVSKKFVYFAPELYYSKWYRINDDGSSPSKITTDDKFKLEDFHSHNPNDPNIFIFPGSSTEKIEEYNLSLIGRDELTKGLNEILARHGYVFKDAKLNIYFKGKKWYKPNDDYVFDKNNLTKSGFNDVEISNYSLIQKHLDMLKPKQ